MLVWLADGGVQHRLRASTSLERWWWQQKALWHTCIQDVGFTEMTPVSPALTCRGECLSDSLSLGPEL